MVKLIRITTNSENGTFDTGFRSPVNVKENSKIALQNLIMAVQKKEIIIDATNDQMFFSVSGGNVRNVFLTRATYDKLNAQSGLLQDIADKLNGGLVFQGGKELGAQFRVSFGTRITIANAFSKLTSYVKEFSSNNPVQALGSATRVLTLSSNSNQNFRMQKNVAATGGGAASADMFSTNFLDEQICKGTGTWRVKLHTLVDEASVDTSGFIIGLVKGNVSKFFQGDPPISGGNFLEKNIFYGVHVNQLTNSIRIIREGTFSNAAFTPNNLNMYAGAGNDNNAVVAIEIQGNTMRVNIYYNGGSQVINTISSDINGNNLDIGKQGYTPFITYRGASANVITFKHQFTQDPFTPNPSDISEEHDTLVGLPTPPTQAGAKRLTFQEVGFISDDLAAELGYVPRRFPPTSSALLPSLTWTADNDFDILTVNDNYMVIMDNHYLDSYDSLEKGQRSIIAVLPVKDDIGAIRFDSNYPIYVDLNNKLPVSMRNIRMRVIRADGTQVNSIGLSTATLLIEE